MSSLAVSQDREGEKWEQGGCPFPSCLQEHPALGKHSVLHLTHVCCELVRAVCLCLVFAVCIVSKGGASGLDQQGLF